MRKLWDADKRAKVRGLFVEGRRLALCVPWRKCAFVAWISLVAAGFWLGLAVGSWHRFLLDVPYQGYHEKSCTVRVAGGTPADAVAEMLERRGVVADARAFSWYVYWKGETGKIRSGAYEFKGPLSMGDVLRRLVRGETATISVTVPEGWAAEQVFRQLAEAGLGSREKYARLWSDASQVKEWAGNAVSLEGYLFPDTYNFPAGYAEEQVLDAMVQRFRRVALPLLRSAKPPRGLSVHEMVTLASLVEKETGRASDRPLIASVFYNRLGEGMKLQCDPTVIYAEWLEKGAWDPKIHASDLRRDSSYNTYQSPGLPPGPICNPGIAAIRAVCNPPKSDYLYFVSDNLGGSVFSKDLSAHNRAVQRYQRGQK